MTDDWKPEDSQILVDAWEDIKDCAEAIQKDKIETAENKDNA